MVDQLLLEFARQAESGPFAYEYCHHHAGGGSHNFHIVIACLVHGNEHGTLPAALRLVSQLKSGALRCGGPVTVLLGNTEAARADRRFLEEDFNRVFTFDREADSLERRLAEQVRPILDQADFFLDIHQTQTPTQKPFWTFPWEPTLGLWARALDAAPVGLTRAAGQVFSKGTCCLDEYVRARGRPALTVEVGFRGPDAEQSERAYAAMLRLIELTDAIESGATDLQTAAGACAAVEWYATTQVVPAASAAHRLRAGLGNWTPVKRGDNVGPEGCPELTIAEDGFILFPKYPQAGEPLPPELFRLATAVADPGKL